MSPTAKKKTKPKARLRSAAKPRAARRHVQAVKKAGVRAPPAPPPERKAPTVEKTYLLAIRLKGSFATPWPIVGALETLRLKRKYNAVLVENTASTVGMLRTVKDYVTWGEAHATDIATLFRERGELSEGRPLTEDAIRERYGESSIQALASALTEGRISLRALWQKGLNPVFRLHPPSGGFEGSAKRAYGSRGELGKRQTALATLLLRMV